MEPNRRPIQTRDAKWAAAVASRLARAGVRPNSISIASAIFGAASGACLALVTQLAPAPAGACYFGAALFMQARLLCNLFDGMVAIEGGFKTKSGELFNELPDRFADAFIIVGAGYSAPHYLGTAWLGWLGAALAILTAYVRALGASAGAAQQFCGPMAKQHRMALLTATCLASALAEWLHLDIQLVPGALAVLCGGCLITVFRRAYRIRLDLESK